MKILIATGIYPPDIGGHSYYAKNLKEALERMGHEVDVVLYGGLRAFPTGLRHLLYAIKLFFVARNADAVIGFDTFSVALPAGLIAPLLRIPFVQRAGGDFVWEEYIRRTHDFIPLPMFYANRARWNWKERVSFRLIRWASGRLHMVFSSAWQRDLWREPYTLDAHHVDVIENALLPRDTGTAPERKNFLLYGRPIPLKNVPTFKRAFARAQEKCPDIQLEDGVLPREALMEKMRTCYAVCIPSISEVTPQTVLEALRYGKPFLLTKHSAYAERFGKFGVLVDPLDEADMARGVEILADPATYHSLCANIAAFNEVRTYDDIAREFLALLK